MRIGIISDTHDHHRNVAQAVEIFARHKVEYVLHAGDIVAPFVTKTFAKLKIAKFIAVYGNNDGEKLFLRQTIEGFGGEIHEFCYKGELVGRKVYMTHTHHNIEEVAASQVYDLLVYGHTHRQDIRKVGRTLIVNPGEATDWITGSSHLVILDLADMTYTVETLGEEK
ncbi:MAG TPA: metallophosphoesterase [Sedimentisphaerales bacterium]|nr:metallophosphoesterase [Sedimentisphaerales bacterium]HQG48827.1 metallophosphoesterase [Sedimentisphaerales bacterium]HQI27167.1 metallophosphoesterase [Sedimentisphaerales bacterium]